MGIILLLSCSFRKHLHCCYDYSILYISKTIVTAVLSFCTCHNPSVVAHLVVLSSANNSSLSSIAWHESKIKRIKSNLLETRAYLKQCTNRCHAAMLSPGCTTCEGNHDDVTNGAIFWTLFTIICSCYNVFHNTLMSFFNFP